MISTFNRYFQEIILKSELLRNASVLFSGTVLAQVISILLQPVVRRFYSPESFGIFSVYASLTGIIVIISALRYDEAIVLPKSDKESINLTGLAILINFFFSLTLFCIVLLLGRKIISFLNLPETLPLSVLYIIPVSAFLFSIYQSLNLWLIRKKKYYPVSSNRLIRRGAEGAGQLSFAALRLNNGLVLSDILGVISSMLAAAVQSFKGGLNLRYLSMNKIKYVFRKYSEFPRYNLVPSFMSTCSYMLPPIFINKFFSSESAGYFDLAKLLLAIPLALVASSLSSVILQKVSEKYNRKESFLPDLKPVLLLVSIVSAGEIITILLFSEGLFGFIFGKQWITSGTVSRIMVWSFALNFIISTFTSIFVSMRKIKIYSAWQLLYFLAIISLMFFRDLPLTDFLKVYVSVEVLCYLILAGVMLAIVLKYENSLKIH